VVVAVAAVAAAAVVVVMMIHSWNWQQLTHSEHAKMYCYWVECGILLFVTNYISVLLQICLEASSSIVVTKGQCFPPVPPHVPYRLRGLPSRLWPKCNRLFRLGRPWGTVTLCRWGAWWYMNMRYEEGR
jgi:hypothetical protein